MKARIRALAKVATRLINKQSGFAGVLMVQSSVLLLPGVAFAQEKDVQDMSDPLAVYTQAGAGYTNRGVNLKFGQAYDTGNPETAGMNVLEFIGGLGDAVGWDEDTLDNAFDSLRFRNFQVDLTNGRGTQIDIAMGFDETPLAEKSGTFSYSLIQSLPKVGRFNFYPLAGAGLAYGENALDNPDTGDVDEGLSLMGGFALVGLYSKVALTDKVWLNYNPFWFSTLVGSDYYKDNAYGQGESDILAHEFAVSYQVSPVFNVRYFANWNDEVDFDDGDHRIEFNYQL